MSAKTPEVIQPLLNEWEQKRICDCGTKMQYVGPIMSQAEPYEADTLYQCPACKTVRIVR